MLDYRSVVKMEVFPKLGWTPYKTTAEDIPSLLFVQQKTLSLQLQLEHQHQRFVAWKIM